MRLRSGPLSKLSRDMGMRRWTVITACGITLLGVTAATEREVAHAFWDADEHPG
jgi:hypothetical protein